MHNIYNNTPFSLSQGLKASLSPLGESLGRSDQRDDSSGRSQVSYGHPKCNLNLVRLSCLSLFLFCLISGFSSSYLTHEAINLQPPSHTFVVPNPATRSCATTVLQFPKRMTSLFCCCWLYWADFFVNSIFGRMVSFILEVFRSEKRENLVSDEPVHSNQSRWFPRSERI